MPHPIDGQHQRLEFHRLPDFGPPPTLLKPLPRLPYGEFPRFAALQRLEVSAAIFRTGCLIGIYVPSAKLLDGTRLRLDDQTCPAAQGLWVGCFGTHGLEILLLRFVPPETPNPFRCPTTRVRLLRSCSHALLACCTEPAEQAMPVQGPRLEAFKVTGDVNVPAGKFSVVADAEAVILGPYDGHEGVLGAGFRPIGVHRLSAHSMQAYMMRLASHALSARQMLASLCRSSDAPTKWSARWVRSLFPGGRNAIRGPLRATDTGAICRRGADELRAWRLGSNVRTPVRALRVVLGVVRCCWPRSAQTSVLLETLTVAASLCRWAPGQVKSSSLLDRLCSYIQPPHIAVAAALMLAHYLQVLVYENDAAGFSMLFDDDGEQFRHVIGELTDLWFRIHLDLNHLASTAASLLT